MLNLQPTNPLSSLKVKTSLIIVAKVSIVITFLIFISGAGCSEDIEPPITEQTGDQKFSSDGSGGFGGCDDYSGPEFDVQVDSQCKMAYAYSCSGDEQGRQAACALYYQWEDSWTGSGSFPDCPYCD